MKKNSSVILDKLLEDYSQIEKKFSDINGKNNLLEIKLEQVNRMWKISEAKEIASKEDHAALNNIIRGLQETVDIQCNLRDENCSLKKKINTLEIKLQETEEKSKSKIDLLKSEMEMKEEDYTLQIENIQYEMNEKIKLKEEEKNILQSKKDMEIAELTKQLRIQEKDKQSELIKQQIEFNAKLSRIQNRTSKLYPDSNALSVNIYRAKLQHLQEEKNREIESLRNTIKNLEGQNRNGQESRLKRKRL